MGPPSFERLLDESAESLAVKVTDVVVRQGYGPARDMCARSATDARGIRFIGKKVAAKRLATGPRKPIDLDASWNNIAEQEITARRLPLPGRLRFPKCRCASRSAE